MNISNSVFNELKDVVLSGDNMSEKAFKMALEEVERKVGSEIKDELFNVANWVCDGGKVISKAKYREFECSDEA